MDQMIHIDLRALEPLPRINRIPRHRERHRPKVDHARIVHVQSVEIGPLVCREAEDGDDERDPGEGEGADGFREAPEVPGSCSNRPVSFPKFWNCRINGISLTRPKLIPDDKQFQRNGEDESNVLRDRADAKHSPDRDRTREHKQAEERAEQKDEPDGVDRGVGVSVDSLEPAAAWHRPIAGVSVDDARGCYGAPVTRLSSVNLA